MIKAVDLTKKFGNKTILKNINLEIEKGQFVTVFGPNGAGKSTLLKLLSLLSKPSSGKVIINSFDTSGGAANTRKEIGVISHNSFLYENLTARENLEFYGRMYGVSDLKNRIFDVLKEVGLDISFQDPVRTFSRGMLQRLSIARAILHNPSILFLDEPYTGLDQQAINILNNVLKRLKDEGRTIFMITHNFEEGLGLSDRIMIMARGSLVYSGDTKELQYKELKEIYQEKVAC